MVVTTTPQATEGPFSGFLDGEVDAVLRRAATSLNGACAHLLLTRGKQLRGRLVLGAARQGPEGDGRSIERAACAIELLHLASLAHDDVIDAGTARRGAATANARFGSQAAGFAGAWLFARAVELISECGQASLDLFSETLQRMCDGGMLELRDLYDTRRTAESYFAAAERKTASAFFCAARLGAELAGASRTVASKAGRFGFEFGMAYQTWDDLVDLLASPEESGKTPESDVRQGVYTLPVIYALEESRELRDRLANRSASDDDEGTVALVQRTAGIERAARAADEHAERAAETLAGLPDPDALRRLLEGARRQHLDLLP